MSHDERGFIYPITLSLLLLFSTVLTIQIGLFVSEKRMLTQSEKINKQEYYLQSTVKSLEKRLADPTHTGEDSGYFTFRGGTSTYEIKPLSEEQLEITIHLLAEDGNEIIGIAQYDHAQQKVTKWVEKR